MMSQTVLFQGQTLTSAEAIERLKALSTEGVEEEAPFGAPELENRIADELDIMGQNVNCLQRLIILWDLARYAREHQIFIGPGAGTLPGSAAAYWLGITGVDPERYGLLFERFQVSMEENRGFPFTAYLSAPDRAEGELTAYLHTTYPGVQPSELFHPDYTVSRIDYALRLADEAGDQRPDFRFQSMDDPKVYKLMAADGTGETFCVFQQGAELLKEVRPRSIEELAAAAAFQARGLFETDRLYQNYLARRDKPDPVSQFLQDDYAQDTRGCLIYQEQIVCLLRELTDCSLKQGVIQDRKLRRMWRPGQPQYALMVSQSDEVGCLSLETGEVLPLMIEPDGQVNCPGAEDGAPVPVLTNLAHRAVGKSHFVSIAILSYQAAYMQCYYPDAFQKACLAIPAPELPG